VTDRWLDFDRGQLGHATYCDVRAAPNWRPFLKIFASGTLCLLPRFYDLEQQTLKGLICG
jgi:hypothetical protein